jgi:hypothetical protein
MCRVRACVDTEMACRHCKCKCRASATVGQLGSVAAQVHFLSKYCVARGIREPDADFFAECIRIINIFAMVLPMSLLFPVCVLCCVIRLSSGRCGGSQAAELRWVLWAVVQAALSPVDFDYLNYACLRFHSGYAKYKAKAHAGLSRS